MIAAVLSVLPAVLATCTTPQVINNFQNFPTSNSVGGHSSSDNTMSTMTATPANSSLTLVGIGSGSYYFESGFCSLNQTYTYFTMGVVPTAANTSFFINFKTSASCDGMRTNNYVNTNATLIPNQVNTISFALPSAVDSNLVAVTIENLQPYQSAVSFTAMTLQCSSPATAATGTPGRNSADRIDFALIPFLLLATVFAY
ncbi:hypothetical protein HDV01_007673 [Terramyces sp. JEL0728]|nr:hypothetical protein HDV01_000431 [Terramyces sp. JEL0728]KAJ3275670.1 hypothetical protein HDV01_007673 [Terramyces sp. JEL0728]